MKGLILCYSTTGNTRLVAKRIAKALSDAGTKTVVRDPVQDPKTSDLASYDIVGFGSPTMAWKPSHGFRQCLGLIPTQKNPKAAFVFCTSSGMPANTLRTMAEWVSKKNFTVLDGLAITAEDCWPVARQLGGPGLGPVGEPGEKVLEKVRSFGRGLAERLSAQNLTPRHFAFQRTPMHYLGLAAGPEALRRAMGRKYVDKTKCQQCGTCASVCAAHAVALEPYPMFSNSCMGCWACYNNCPNEAILTTVTGSRGHYKGPSIRA